jgi:alpha-galactosidase
MWSFPSCIVFIAVQTVAYDNGAPHSRMPPLGWSSWVGLGPSWPGPDAAAPVFDFCDEASVHASIDAFHEVGLYDAGYRHFHLDDCWVDLERNASGFLQAERDHFPNGMKPLVDYAHSKGLTFGLYTCAGTYTCVGKRPGSRGHFTQDAQVFAEWGVDVMKMDWCNSDGMQPEETYSEMSKALNQTGHPIHFNMCEWGKDAPWDWAPKIAQSWRSGTDHTGVWTSTRDIIADRTKIPPSEGGAAFAWNDMDMLQSGNYKQAAHANGREGTMTSTEYKTEFSMWAILASPLVVTTPILNCSKTDQINGKYTPGTCTPSITPLQKEILFNKEIIDINQDVTMAGRLVSPSLSEYLQLSSECSLASQLSEASCTLGKTFGCYENNKSMWARDGCRGIFTCSGVTGVKCDVMGGPFHVCPCKAPEPTAAPVYARNLSDGSVAVALYNPEDVTGLGSFEFASLGWSSSATASVRDLWLHQDLGSFTDRYPAKGTVPVEPHATVMLRVTRKEIIV